MSAVAAETRPLTWIAAARLVQAVEDAFDAADLAAISAGFTPDAVARFADFPEMQGREAIMRFLTARFARTRNYRLKKTLRSVMGDVIGNTWAATWEDGQTGKPMQGRGTEFWVMRGNQIAVWDATFNAWERGGPPTTPVI